MNMREMFISEKNLPRSHGELLIKKLRKSHSEAKPKNLARLFRSIRILHFVQDDS